MHLWIRRHACIHSHLFWVDSIWFIWVLRLSFRPFSLVQSTHTHTHTHTQDKLQGKNLWGVQKNINIASFKTTSISALTNGERALIAPVDGNTPQFEPGVAYIIKDYTLSTKFGRECIFLGPRSKKCKTAPFELPKEAEKRAKDLLNPPTVLMTGEEEDLFTRGGYIFLKGEIKRVSKFI